MKRSKKLSPVVEVAVKAAERALLKVGEENTVWQQDKQQLDDLYRYKGEYLAKFRQGDSLMISAQKMLELRAFLVQLDQAIAAQQQQVENSYKRVQYQQTLWLQARTKEQAMQTLVGRYKAEESQQEVRQEQLDNDEHNTSQWVRKPRKD
ncbi:MAG: flagellar export protein FliJ [Proteobacteria bacterium]|nr:flagellar export protein FliJ [Pseudomonadota bacterium]